MMGVIDLFGNLYAVAASVFPAVLIFFVIRWRTGKQDRREPFKKLAKIIVFAIYVYLVFSVTGAGTIYEIGSYPELIRLDEISWRLFDSEGGLTYILNIIMCVPFGFLVPFIWEKVRFKGTVCAGFLFSFLIEASQLLNRRNSAVDDLLMNTIGAAIGCLVFLLYRQMYVHLFHRSSKNKNICIRFLDQERQVLKYEHLLYIAGMFLGHFLLYDWRGYVWLFYDYYYK